MGWKKLVGLVGVFLMAMAVFVAAATISNVVWENAITEPDVGYAADIIEGQPATINITILKSDGQPFAPANFPPNTTLTVRGRFVDEYGNAIDMTGDGVPDIWNFTNTSTPGLWTATINVSNVQPGMYTFEISAVATNSTTGAIIDNATLREQIWVAGGPYWVAIANVHDGQEIRIGSFNFTITSLSDVGAILTLPNLTALTLTDNDHTGILAFQRDVTGDGASDWLMFIKSTDEDNNPVYNLYIYSKDASLLDDFNQSTIDFYRTKGNMIVFTNRVFKDPNDNYKAWVAWDNSLLAKLGIKAVDYYIIPVRGREHWWERGAPAAHEDVKIIKRTTYLWGLFGNDKVVYEGNIFGKNVNIDNVLKVFGKFAGNNALFDTRNWRWEIKKAMGDITIPNDYDLQGRELRDLAIDDDLWRGFNPLKTSKHGFFSESVDWENLLGLANDSEGS